jgi:hypothetical protein
VAIKFCFKARKTATETVELVRATNVDDTLTGSNERLSEGWNEVQGDPRSGRPSESSTENKMERVRQVLLQNRHFE